MSQIKLRAFTEPEYHRFFRNYEPDPRMTNDPFTYSREQISRSWRYNYGGFRPDYDHYGIFLDEEPVGAFQLKRISPENHRCEFGIILQNDRMKNRGIGTEAVRAGMEIARRKHGVQTLIGDTMGRNLPMRRVFEKLGFRLAETVPDAFMLPDGSSDCRMVWMIDLAPAETEEQP